MNRRLRTATGQTQGKACSLTTLDKRAETNERKKNATTPPPRDTHALDEQACLLLAPLALYPKAGALGTPLCGVLTLFYRGLLELAKSFLDPFGNEGSRAQNIQSDVLLAEVNRGSSGWWRAGARVPYDAPFGRLRLLRAPLRHAAATAGTGP